MDLDQFNVSVDNGYDSDVILFKGRKSATRSGKVQSFKALITSSKAHTMIQEGLGNEIILFRGRKGDRVFHLMNLPGEIRNMIYRAVDPSSHAESLINLRDYRKHPLAQSSRKLEAEFLPIWHTKCNFMVDIKSISNWDFAIVYEWMAHFGIYATEHINSLSIRLDIRFQYSSNVAYPFWADVECTLYQESDDDGGDKISRDVIVVDFGERICLHKTSIFHYDLREYVEHNLTGQARFTISAFVHLTEFIWFWVHRIRENLPERAIKVCSTRKCCAPADGRVQKYEFRSAGYRD